jgi:hypothetical protein
MRFGRRPLFFLAVVAISLLLVPPTPSDFRWVNLTMASIASFWFVLLAIEEAQGNRLSEEEIAHTLTTNPTQREERP